MMKLHRSSLLVLVLLCGLGCNRSSDDDSTSVVVASQLAYDSTPREYRVGAAVRALAPAADGAVSNYTLDPAPPTGLTLDPATGVLAGVPTESAPLTDYTVRAELADGGLLATTIRFAVFDSFDAKRFGYSLSLFPGTITTWRYDAALDSYVAAGGSGDLIAPARAEVHPLGDRLYVLDAFAATVVTFSIDPTSGALEQIDSDPVGTGPIALEISEDGRFAYAGSEEQLSVFRIDPFDGTLQLAQDPLPLPMVSGIAVSPDGTKLAVGSSFYFAFGVWDLDPDEGTLGAFRGFAPLGTPYALEFSPDGRRLYGASLSDAVLRVFDTDPPAPFIAPLATFTTPVGTFDIEQRADFLWLAHYSDGAVSRYGIDGDGMPEPGPQILVLPGNPTSVRPSATGGYTLPLFDAGFAQYADGPATPPAFVPMRQFLADLVLAPAPTGRVRTTPFVAALDGDTAGVTLVSTSGGATAGPFLAGPAPRALTTDAAGERLVVGDGLNGSLRRFDVDTPQASVIPRGIAAPAGFEVRDLALDGGGARLWALTDGQLITYELPKNGTPIQIDQAPIGPDPRRIALDPLGRFIACTEAQSDRLHLFRVSPGSDEPVPSGNSPLSLLDIGETSVGAGAVAFEPLGKIVLVALEELGAVRSYLVNPVTGALLPAGSVAGLGRPVDLDVDSGGLRVVVADDATPAIHLLAVDPKGIPFLLDTLATTETPRRLVLEADGSAARFTTAEGSVGRVSIDGDALVLDGLTPLGLSDPVDLAPVALWVEPGP